MAGPRTRDAWSALRRWSVAPIGGSDAYDAHLLEILQKLRGVPGVLSTEAFVYLKLRKQTYSWGTA